ncbi:MAG: paraslipin, partial [Proteobacteria bacterium]|nr:paraslipin [Pseudomonadota bacterium]
MGLFTLALLVFAVVFVLMTVKIVPQQHAYIVERLGKFNKIFEAGLHFMSP